MHSSQSSTACAMSRLFSVRMIVKETCSGQPENTFENKVGNGKCLSFSCENCKSIVLQMMIEDVLLHVMFEKPKRLWSWS